MLSQGSPVISPLFFVGILISFSKSVSENAPLSIVVTESGIVIVLSFVPLNANPPIVLTVSGNITAFRGVLLNAKCPISSSLLFSPNVIFSRVVSENALVSIFLTESGMVIFFILVPIKASLGITFN